ncbi:putative translation elongation factor Tu [Dictyocaulus viviparus]|uniref:Putative translation elongation factor Tu n=1 Tax=Dictyocaulus viviparus TaxID=29172 RepID=A0A0D8XRZ2_DICVI|nr:putative translation elongation factor Tu [Dictyocaulus viviparus]
MSSGGWNVNAAAFVPNISNRTFVSSNSYPSNDTLPQDSAEAPIEEWDADVGDSAASAEEQISYAASEIPATEPSTKVIDCSRDKNEDEKYTLEMSDVVAPLAKKFERIAYVDDGTHKEHVNMVFIGHVDAGKSTIGVIQLHFNVFMIFSLHILDSPRYLSWCMDTNEEEREKGKTVECGRAYFETEKKHFTILDAPGHKSFVPNMISGATQADLAVLVISARKGEFETGFDRGGQTREHAMLVKTAGVRHLVILVNKMDDPTVKWDENRFNEIQNKLTPYLRKCGFNPKTDMTYIPVSGLTGAFIKDRPSCDQGGWYSGPCFIDYIDNHLISMVRDYNGPVRCIVVDKFSVCFKFFSYIVFTYMGKDMGTLIIGKMESGVVVKGQNLVLMPNKQAVQVIQIWSDEVETDRVVSGDNVKFKLKGVEENEIQSGFIICSADTLCKVGRVFDAEVVILEHKSIIASGYTCVLHIQSAVEEVSVKMVICTIDKKTGEKKKSRFVRQDEKCIMRIESAEAFCLEPFKELPQLGRFTLRDEGRTIAIGKVLKVVE